MKHPDWAKLYLNPSVQKWSILALADNRGLNLPVTPIYT